MGLVTLGEGGRYLGGNRNHETKLALALFFRNEKQTISQYRRFSIAGTVARSKPRFHFSQRLGQDKWRQAFYLTKCPVTIAAYVYKILIISARSDWLRKYPAWLNHPVPGLLRPCPSAPPKWRLIHKEHYFLERKFSFVRY